MWNENLIPVTPVSRPLLIVLSALLAATALAAPPAHAQGQLTFTRMTIEDCKEMGTCEWKLGCQVAGGALTDLVPNAAGRDGAAIDIDRRVPVARFPVEVRCTAWEDDGMLGTSWKEVATGVATLPAGGDYTIELASDEQGKVHALLSADSLEAGVPPPPDSPRRFLGVFRAGDKGTAVVVGLDWATFDARRAALAKAGVQIVQVESWADGPKRVWSGLFQTDAEPHELVTGLEWDAFVAKQETMAKRGMPMIDFLTYADGKKRLFAAVFRPGGETSSLWVGQTQVGFQNQFNKLVGQGMRLVDLDTYKAGKDTVYAGVFLPAGGSTGWKPALEWGAFEAEVKAAEGRGMRLVDVETAIDGKKRLYDGAFRGGSGGQALDANLDWATFAARWRERTAKGLRLVDLTSFAE